MSGSGGRWRSALLGALITAQIGCAARGGVMGPELPDAGGPIEAVKVTAGEGRVRVKRGGYAETWREETGRCTRDLAVPVAIQTFGLGLIVLPAVCGGMSAALPGMTTKFRAGAMRRAVEQGLATGNLHMTLRDAIASATVDTGPDPDAILEVTITELWVRDDGTLAGISARARLLRAGDRSDLVSRTFAHEPSGRETWSLALDPAVAVLATSIRAAMVPTGRGATRGQGAEDAP